MMGKRIISPELILYGKFRQQYDIARDGWFPINTNLQEASADPVHPLLNWSRATNPGGDWGVSYNCYCDPRYWLAAPSKPGGL